MVLYGMYVCDFYVDTLIHYYWYLSYLPTGDDPEILL